MTLLDWMMKSGQDIKAVSQNLGCSIYAVRKWVRKERTPRPQMQAKIRKLTKGEVGGEDWMPQD